MLQHGFVFPTPTGASIPSFPNYRLGPLDNPGVPCTATVGVSAGPEVEREVVKVYPNPASDELTIEYHFADDAERRLLFYDAYGQMVKDVSLPAPSGKVNIPVGKMALRRLLVCVTRHECHCSVRQDHYQPLISEFNTAA
ncbi:MAG: hypothetical protein IPJ82_08880 [Lewinellaceae bacterium]|nr:hypothetical protein [Lewinellaceae bacterium]